MGIRDQTPSFFPSAPPIDWLDPYDADGYPALLEHTRAEAQGWTYEVARSHSSMGSFQCDALKFAVERGLIPAVQFDTQLAVVEAAEERTRELWQQRQESYEIAQQVTRTMNSQSTTHVEIAVEPVAERRSPSSKHGRSMDTLTDTV